MTLGPELITNGDFSTATYDSGLEMMVPDGWVTSRGANFWTWSDTNKNVTYTRSENDSGVMTEYGTLYQDMGGYEAGVLVNDHTYLVSFDISGGNTTANQYLYIALGEVLSIVSTRFVVPITDGHVEIPVIAHGNVSPNAQGVRGVHFWMGFSTATITLDNVSVKEILDVLPTGGEMATNGDFTGSAAGWTLGANWSYGTDNLSKSSGAGATVSQNMGFRANNFYLVTLTVTAPADISDYRVNVDGNYFGDALDPYSNEGTTITSRFIIQTRDDNNLFMGPITTGTFNFVTASDFTGTVDSISVKQILLDGELPDYNTSLISVVNAVQQNLPFPQFVLGGSGGTSGTTYKLFKKADTGGFNLWRSKVFQIGKDFDILSVNFNLIPDLTANTSIVPVLYFDDGSSSSVGTTINNTNFSNDNKYIQLESKAFNNSVRGHDNFFLELQFTGSDLAVVDLPITIDVDIHDT